MAPTGRTGVGGRITRRRPSEATNGWASYLLNDRDLACECDVDRRSIGLLFWIFQRSYLVCALPRHRYRLSRVARFEK
jgi:hypothetical protein